MNELLEDVSCRFVGEVKIPCDNIMRKIELKIDRARPSNTFVFLGDGDDESIAFSSAFAKFRGNLPETSQIDPNSTGLATQPAPALPPNQHPMDWSGIIPTVYYEPQAQQLRSLSLQRIQLDATRIQLDATQMGSRVELKKYLGISQDSKITLWFQCPWSKDCRTNQGSFLKEVVLSAACVQAIGELLLIGVCVDTDFAKMYGRLQTIFPPFYECIGADQSFVGEMLNNGYRHRTVNGGQLGLMKNEDFATIVFQRTNRWILPFLAGFYLAELPMGSSDSVGMYSTNPAVQPLELNNPYFHTLETLYCNLRDNPNEYYFVQQIGRDQNYRFRVEEVETGEGIVVKTVRLYVESTMWRPGCVEFPLDSFKDWLIHNRQS